MVQSTHSIAMETLNAEHAKMRTKKSPNLKEELEASDNNKRAIQDMRGIKLLWVNPFRGSQFVFLTEKISSEEN